MRELRGRVSAGRSDDYEEKKESPQQDVGKGKPNKWMTQRISREESASKVFSVEIAEEKGGKEK